MSHSIESQTQFNIQTSKRENCECKHEATGDDLCGMQCKRKFFGDVSRSAVELLESCGGGVGMKNYVQYFSWLISVLPHEAHPKVLYKFLRVKYFRNLSSKGVSRARFCHQSY
jgi:hypothetical protein